MTAALSPVLAVAYVTELSADVTAVVVLDERLEALAGPPSHHEAARALAGLLDAGIVRTAEGVATVVRGRDRAIVVAAGPSSLAGPTALDVAAALGCAPPGLVDAPSPAVAAAATAVLRAG